MIRISPSGIRSNVTSNTASLMPSPRCGSNPCPSAAHYDELRLLFYIGRFGQRMPYQQACALLSYLRDAKWEDVQYRLSIFRYAADTSIAKEETKQWMIEDLAAVLGVTPEDFPLKKLPMPRSLKTALKKINPDLGDSYDY